MRKVRLLPALVWCALLALSATDTALAQQRRVMAIHAARREAPSTIILDQTIQRVLSRSFKESLDYHNEFIDTARFFEPGYWPALRDFLKQKYAGQRFDLVIASTDTAVDFVREHRSELFPDAAVVFSAGLSARPPAHATGQVSALDLSRTLTLVDQLQPQTTQVFVVSGSSPYDQYYEAIAREQFRAFAHRFTFTFWTGLRMEEFVERVANLPPNSILFPLTIAEDGAGRRFLPLDSFDRIVAATNAPTYTWTTLAMNRGVVGGSLNSAPLLATRLAELAVRVLNGEMPEDIPIARVDANVNEVDWRQLRRWGISPSRVPAGTAVLFREPGLWERYWQYILGIAILVGLQTALIAGLLVQRVRRRRVEVALHASEGRYVRATAAGRVGVWDWDLDSNNIYVDPELKRILGYEDAEIPNQLDHWGANVHPDDRTAVMTQAQACIDRVTDAYEVEHRMLHKDGSIRWFLARGSAIRGPDGRTHRMIGTDTDITERRLAETRLRDNETALRKSHEDNKDLVGRLITAQEAERTRIARDLHDDVSQELAGLSIALSSLKRRLIGTGQTKDIEDTLTTVQQRTIALADNIRGLSHDLHPGILQHVGLAAALQAHCAELGRHQPFKLQMKADSDLGPIDPLIALCLYRVAQEGLANATRHARPQSVQVRLHRTHEGYELSIVDDGCGFDPAGGNGNSLGLRSMDERVRFLGGTLGVESHPGHGTKLLARIPLIDGA